MRDKIYTWLVEKYLNVFTPEWLREFYGIFLRILD
jgi:hypothetical protein